MLGQLIARRFAELKHLVFWPPFLSMLVAMVYSLIHPKGFLAKMTVAQNWILDHFGLLFSWAGVWMLLLCILCYFSPIGRLRVGGSNAEPLFSKWKP